MDKYTVTQLIYLNDGGREDFLEYESTVLPLLEKYNGKLKFRIRPGRDNFIYPSEGELPYEVHIVSFGSKQDFVNFKNDPERLKHIVLAERSVKKIILIESEGTNRDG